MKTTNTKLRGEVPKAEVGAQLDVEQGIYNIIDGSCYLAEIWVMQSKEMEEIEHDLDTLIKRLHKGEKLNFDEIERLSDHIIVKQTKNARASYLVGLEQGIKLTNLLQTDNLAKYALEHNLI